MATVSIIKATYSDLDMETLELLEELLCNYDGTLILVSHDRTFLDNVVTSTLAFEGDGEINEYVGGYEDWLRQSRKTNTQTTVKKTGKNEAKPEKSKTKLSYKVQKELDELPQKIETLEAEQEDIQQQVSDAGFYEQEQTNIDKVLARLSKLEKELEVAYQRWEELSD